MLCLMVKRVVLLCLKPLNSTRRSIAGWKVQSFGSAILLSALGAFWANGIAFGQAPSQSVGAGGSVNDQGRITAEPVALQRPQPGQGNPLLTIPLESLRATRERPLFSATRRPPPPVVTEGAKVSEPVSAPKPSEPEKPQVALVGVVHGPLIDIAVFLDETDKSLMRLRVGQSVRGWIVHDLDARAATLEKAKQQVKLELPARNTGIAAATPSPTEAALALDQ